MDGLLDLDESQGSRSAERVPVLLPVALEQTYDYLVPDGLEVEPGELLGVYAKPLEDDLVLSFEQRVNALEKDQQSQDDPCNCEDNQKEFHAARQLSVGTCFSRV